MTYPLAARSHDAVMFAPTPSECLSWRADGFDLRLSLETPDDTGIPIGDYMLMSDTPPGKHIVSCGEGVKGELELEILQDGPDEHSDIRPMVWVELLQVTLSNDRYQALCQQLSK